MRKIFLITIIVIFLGGCGTQKNQNKTLEAKDIEVKEQTILPIQLVVRNSTINEKKQLNLIKVRAFDLIGIKLEYYLKRRVDKFV